MTMAEVNGRSIERYESECRPVILYPLALPWVRSRMYARHDSREGRSSDVTMKGWVFPYTECQRSFTLAANGVDVYKYCEFRCVGSCLPK